MNLIKYFLKFFDVFFHRHNSLKKTNDDNKGQGLSHESFSGNGTTPIKTGNKDENHHNGNNNSIDKGANVVHDDGKGQGPNHESFSGNSTTPIKADNKDENHYEGNNNPTNNVNKTNEHTIRANRPYTVQVIPFLKSELDLDYNGRYMVNYSISDSRVMEFPVIRAPKKGCEIKLPVRGRCGKRGVCEQKLCEEIEKLNLLGFYDNLSLFVTDRRFRYEPDLAYIDAKKGIFIDIEIDEPYSGLERKPIHYTIGNYTVDDKRNDDFTERGWTVIRFSETQVYKQPQSCLKYVYKLLHDMDTSIRMPHNLAAVDDIKICPMWDKNCAERMASERKRETLLGINRFIEQSEERKPDVIYDYSHGREIENDILKHKEQQGKQQSSGIYCTRLSPVKDTGCQYSVEAEKQKEIQNISTQSEPKTTPSSRGYA